MLSPPPLMCLLCACSDLILSFHRQGQARERRKTRGTSVGIEISKSPSPPKAALTQQPKAANTIPTSTCQYHISTSAPETSRKVSKMEAACPYPDGTTTTEQKRQAQTPQSDPPTFQPPYLLAGPTTTEQQRQAQNATQSTPTLTTSILI